MNLNHDYIGAPRLAPPGLVPKGLGPLRLGDTPGLGTPPGLGTLQAWGPPRLGKSTPGLISLSPQRLELMVFRLLSLSTTLYLERDLAS